GVGNAQSKEIHGAALWNTGRTRVRSAEILHRQVGRRSRDRNHRTGSKRTESPAASNAGGSRAGSNITMLVVPMMCQPPGVSSGYTPVCAAAIATLPEIGRAHV